MAGQRDAIQSFVRKARVAWPNPDEKGPPPPRCADIVRMATLRKMRELRSAFDGGRCRRACSCNCAACPPWLQKGQGVDDRLAVGSRLQPSSKASPANSWSSCTLPWIGEPVVPARRCGLRPASPVRCRDLRKSGLFGPSTTRACPAMRVVDEPAAIVHGADDEDHRRENQRRRRRRRRTPGFRRYRATTEQRRRGRRPLQHRRPGRRGRGSRSTTARWGPRPSGRG